MPKSANKPSKAGKRNPFKVVIAIDAVMDYPTLLRGIVSDGLIYPGRSSLELQQFPSFQEPDWELPEPFETFFEKCIREENFFQRVKPYDFALREIAYLSSIGASITVLTPTDFLAHHFYEINQWVRNTLPGAHTVAGELNDISHNADIFVVRNPDDAKWLRTNGRPFILIDGIENASLRNMVRAIRWDQVGYILRHAKAIKDSASHHSRLLPRAGYIHPEILAGHQNVWFDYRFFPPNINESAIWIGKNMQLARRILEDPYFDFTFSNGAPFSDDQIRRTKMAARSDLAELRRKQRLMQELSEAAMDVRIDYPDWATWITNREAEMKSQVFEIGKSLQIDRVTGKKIRKKSRPAAKKGTNAPSQMPARITITNRELGLPAKPSTTDVLSLFADWSMRLNLQEIRGNIHNRRGYLSELIAQDFLRSKGWKILQPRDGDQARQAPAFDHQVVVSWKEQDPKSVDENKKVTYSAEVDGLAIDPDGNLHVIEVKASRRNATLTALQKRLHTHLSSGGKIENPWCVGLRKDVHQFSARFTVVTFEAMPQLRVPSRPRGLSR